MTHNPTHRRTAFAITTLTALLGTNTEMFAQKKRQPNVILVMTDDQGYGDIAVHGNKMINTPNLDTLHGQSVRFTDFHVDPTCSPTRSALMSGRYSTRTGVWHTIMGRSLMRTEEVTIAEVLRGGDYRTGMFGKWHLGENYPLRPMDQGFDYVVRHGGGGVGQGPDYWGNDYFNDTYWRNGVPEKFKGYCTDIWFDEAIAFVKRNTDRPFFCYVSTNAPHGPLNVAAKWSEPYVKKGVAPSQAKFYGMIENIDWNLGRLGKVLVEHGLTDNTIFIFMTDNGTAAGRVNANLVKQGKWGGFNSGMKGNKGSEYDGGHRVPCFVRWPAGGIGGDKARDEDYLCAHIDLLPTIAGLCSVQRPDGPKIDGVDLSQRLKDKAAALPDRTLFVHSQRIPDPRKWRKCAVMTKRWRLVNGKELYDMDADPGQRTKVQDAHPKVVARLIAAYDAWWESLSVAFDKPVHIGLGSDAETSTQLHPHDWQVKGQRSSSWHQNHVRNGHMGQGKWFVDVLRAGKYRIELRRWPRHLDRAIDAKHARITIAGLDVDHAVKTDAKQTTFEVELQKGTTTLQTWLTLANDKTRGAYFVYVSRVP